MRMRLPPHALFSVGLALAVFGYFGVVVRAHSAGAVVTAAADHRYVHSLYEEVSMRLPQHNTSPNTQNR